MHIYFSGIGGSGLSALAHLGLDAGHKVSGSDQHRSQNIDKLTERSVSFSTNQDGGWLRQTHQENKLDWVVVTSALSTDHPEIVAAKELDIKVTKREGFINHILKERELKLIAVSGTHGKTTTTAMVAWAMKEMEKPISWIIGTNVPFGNSGHLDQDSAYLVLEADEYDRHMLSYQPDLSLIPSLDWDHPDIYPTEENYLESFMQFVEQSSKTITWDSLCHKVESDRANIVCLPNDMPNSSKLAGQVYRDNALLAAHALGQINTMFVDEAIGVLDRFPGTQRRFEHLNPNLISDYAHHPVEIKAALDMAREYVTKNDLEKVIAVYQPHQDKRQRAIADQYQDCFENADHVYWLPTYNPTGRDTQDALTPDELTAKLAKPTISEIAELSDKLSGKIKMHLQRNDLVILLSAGDADPWLRELIQT
jgi:UDP-N-acetylmuramate--alanine ligase